ncbi:receptor activity-modifying protein 1-like isoform X1 [Pimephales promelas]|uniref:receptor activity-modifying protein 1-like isoform X1 n=2 Tax=Pimephales promelas TaxID=90988 RepID=UPI0019556E8A|nr:receptor activity-modifying protein 1-like isoform X1 [Pimephales promelas]
MFYLSGLLLLLLDSSMICGQMTQDDRTASEDKSPTVQTENTQKELNVSLSKETHNVTYEDNEDFQDQDSYYSRCNEELLKFYTEEECCVTFNNNMSALGKENWCKMEMVLRSYNKLTECLEVISSVLGCFYPNRVVEQLFVRIHQQYFSICSDEGDLSDAPAGVVLVGTLLPILLIPLIVYIVVWKSSLRD